MIYSVHFILLYFLNFLYLKKKKWLSCILQSVLPHIMLFLIILWLRAGLRVQSRERERLGLATATVSFRAVTYLKLLTLLWQAVHQGWRGSSMGLTLFLFHVNLPNVCGLLFTFNFKCLKVITCKCDKNNNNHISFVFVLSTAKLACEMHIKL